MKEYAANGTLLGMRYGCLGPKQTQGQGGSFWVSNWSAWVCTAAKVAYNAAKDAGLPGRPDPLMGSHTEMARCQRDREVPSGYMRRGDG